MIDLEAVYKVRQAQAWPQCPMTFKCQPGSHVWLSGPNGCGKTTLLEIIIGKLSHEGHCHRDYQSSIYIPSVCSFKLLQPVKECLSWYQCLYLSDEAVDDVAGIWGLSYCLEKPIQQLSRGQQQRLLLAQLSFIWNDLWVLDEPTLGLDTQGLNILAQLIQSHMDAGGSIIEAGHLWLYPWEPQKTVEVSYHEI